MQENRALSPMDAFELGVFEGGIALVARKWLSPAKIRTIFATCGVEMRRCVVAAALSAC